MINLTTNVLNVLVSNLVYFTVNVPWRYGPNLSGSWIMCSSSPTPCAQDIQGTPCDMVLLSQARPASRLVEPASNRTSTGN